jgi:hypothetical protein
MKKKFIGVAALAIALTSGWLIAADHIDAPAVTGPSSQSLGNDITDVYAFQSPANNANLVLVGNTQGLLSPGATAGASFDENVMYEFNIDNNGDNVEDLLIQCIVKNGMLRVIGPAATNTPGIASTIIKNGLVTEARVTAYGSSPVVGTNANGIKVFAGPRDDPFFFDLGRFKEVIGGTQTSFRNPGVDAFAGTNVMSLVVEVPKSLLGTSPNINVWLESKAKTK